MNLDWIKIIYAYNCWANTRIFDAVLNLTSEKYIMDLKSSYNSLRETLVHIISAEWIWLMRMKGSSPKALWQSSDFPDVSVLRQHWEEVVSKQNEFLDPITKESLNDSITYINTRNEAFTYPLWQILLHLVNHSSYHRGQITTMLRQLGEETVPLDFLVYADVQNEIQKFSNEKNTRRNMKE